MKSSSIWLVLKLKDNGIIIRKTHYKNDDEIINIITSNDKLLTLIAKGSKKMTSKSSKTTSLLNIIEFNYIEKGDVKILTSTEVIENNFELCSNIFQSITALYIADLICLQFEKYEQKDIYELYLRLLVNEHKYDSALKIMLMILKSQRCLTTTGKCVVCESNKDISFFSFIENGFICKECTREKLKEKTLKNIYLFLQEDYFNSDFDLKDSLVLIKSCVNNFDKLTGIKPKSTSFFLKELPDVGS